MHHTHRTQRQDGRYNNKKKGQTRVTAHNNNIMAISLSVSCSRGISSSRSRVMPRAPQGGGRTRTTNRGDEL